MKTVGSKQVEWLDTVRESARHRVRAGVAQSVYWLRYLLYRPGFESQQRQEILQNVQTVCGAQPVACSMGTGFFPVVKQPEADADHSSPSSAEVKNECIWTSASCNAFMAWTGTKLKPRRDKLKFFTQISDLIKMCFRGSRVICVRTDGQSDFNRRSTEMRTLLNGIYRHKCAWCS
jgi:hypothetical protein